MPDVGLLVFVRDEPTTRWNWRFCSSDSCMITCNSISELFLGWKSRLWNCECKPASSSQWIKGERCDLWFELPQTCLSPLLCLSLCLSKFPACGIHKFPLESFSSCVHSSVFSFVGIWKKKKKNPEGVWSYAHSSLKIKTKFLQQIMNSKFTLPPSKKKKKKERENFVSHGLWGTKCAVSSGIKFKRGNTKPQF